MEEKAIISSVGLDNRGHGLHMYIIEVLEEPKEDE